MMFNLKESQQKNVGFLYLKYLIALYVQIITFAIQNIIYKT